MTLKTYRLLQIILTPLIYLYLHYRKIKGREHPVRFPERLGKNLAPRPKGFLVWIHAASIGEAVSIMPLIAKIREQYNAVNIMVTTGTVTSAKLLESKLPKDVLHQFVPIDLYHPVKRFLKHFRPDLAIWVESELWPNLVYETHITGCPMVLVNARMSVESMEKWGRHRALAYKVFNSFSLCLTQNEDEKNKFSRLGIKHTEVGGNLKYEAPPLPADPEVLNKLVGAIGSRPVFLAASTSRGEEEIIIAAHKKIIEKYPELLTIIAPRHPIRAFEIKKLLKEASANYSQRSAKEKIYPQTEVYLADTIGELGIFYRLSSIVFMGGSLVEHGGQNPLEPARLDCAILTGYNIYNFKDIYAEMQNNNAVIMINNGEELAEKVVLLISNADLCNQLAKNSTEVVNSKNGIIDKYMEYLKPYLNPINKGQ